MMKILNINKNFDNILDKFLLKRKNSIRLNSVSVSNIINDVKKKWR